MRPTVIVDGRREYRVHVRNSEVAADRNAPRHAVQDWMRDFRERARSCRATCPAFLAEDYGIATRLLRKYPRDRLDELAEIFWLQYSDPLDEGYGHPLRLFASAIPDIARRMG